MPALASAAERTRQLRVIWIAMVAAMAVYWIIRILAAPRSASLMWPAPLPVALLVLAIGDYALAWWWYQRGIGQVVRRLTPTTIQQLSGAERRDIADRVFASVIACFACLEVPVLLGLLNSFGVSTMPRLFEALALSSVAGMVLFRLKALPGITALLESLLAAP